MARLSHQGGEEVVGLKPDPRIPWVRLQSDTCGDRHERRNGQLRLADVAELRAAHLIVDDLPPFAAGCAGAGCCTNSQSPGASLISRLRANKSSSTRPGTAADPRRSRALAAHARSARHASYVVSCSMFSGVASTGEVSAIWKRAIDSSSSHE